MQERPEFNTDTAETAVKDKRVVGLELVVNSSSNSASLRYNLDEMAKEIECVQKEQELLEELEDSGLALFFFRKSTQHLKNPHFSYIFSMLLLDFQDKKRNLYHFIQTKNGQNEQNHAPPSETMYPSKGYTGGTQDGTGGVHSGDNKNDHMLEI